MAIRFASETSLLRQVSDPVSAGLLMAALGVIPGVAGAEPTAEADAAPDAAVEEMLVVGSRRAEMDVLAGASTTRIGTDLRLVEGMQIDDLLAEVPGVQIRRFGGVGERFEISVRGSRPEQVPVFLDGVRLDTSLTGRSDLSTICLDVLEEIQVTRGAGAARAGTGGIGGVVNLVSRRPTEEPETRVRASVGNFGTAEGSIRHARTHGPWSVALAYCGFRTEGDFEFLERQERVGGVLIGTPQTRTRENNESERHTGLLQIGRKLGRGDLRLTQLTTGIDRGTPGLDSAPLTRAHEENLSTLSSLSLDHPISALPGGNFDLTFSHRYESNDFENTQVGLAEDPVDSETEVERFTLRARGRIEGQALAAEHEFSVLAEGQIDQRRSNEADSRSRGALSLRAELTSRWLDDRLRVSPSLRFERLQGLQEEWIPGVFVQVLPFPWIELKSSASRSYRAPSFQELYLPNKGFIRGNENLEPERAWNYEAGLVLKSPFTLPWLDVEIEATGFWGEIDDSIAFRLISTSVIAPVNTGKAETEGYELALRWRPHPWIRLSGSRTVTRAKDARSGRRLPGIAVSQVDGRLELGPRDRFRLVGEVHYTGRIPLDEGEFSQLSSRVTLDASVALDLTQLPIPGAKRLGRSLWLSVRGRNLSNRAVRDTLSFPQPGRNFALALEGVF